MRRLSVRSASRICRTPAKPDPTTVTSSSAACVRAVDHGSSRSRSAAISRAGREVPAAKPSPSWRDEAPESQIAIRLTSTARTRTATGPSPKDTGLPKTGVSARAASVTASSRVAVPDSRPGPRTGRTRRTRPSGSATTRRSATALTTAPSTGTASTTTPAQALAYGSSGMATAAVAATAPARHASPDSSAAIRRTCHGPAPASRSAASRRSRCTAPIRAHCPRNPSTGMSSSPSARLTFRRSLGESNSPDPKDTE